MRKIHKNIPVMFEPDGFLVVEKEYSESTNKNNESIFTVANGYIGLRGFFEEGFYGDEANSDANTMLNGIYEYYDYHHIWQRPGFPPRYHAITNQANPVDVCVFVDGEKISLCEKVENYNRTLDMRDGTVVRKFDYYTANKKTVKLTYGRFAYQKDKHLLVSDVRVSVNKPAEIKISSRLSQQYCGSGRAKAEIGGGSGDIYNFGETGYSDNTKYVTYSTKRSGFNIVCAVTENAGDCTAECKQTNDSVIFDYTYKAEPEKEMRLERFVIFATSRDFDDYINTAVKKSREYAKKGYDDILTENASAWADFWEYSDVKIDGDDLVQQGIRYGIFNIYQSVGRDGITNISANGLTGTAYSGHYFWDTEIFIQPMLLYTHPEITKKLIEYRYNTLDASRQRAKEMEHPGALISWNTTNGEECGHVFEAVTAHYHINADIGYSIFKYFEATHDEDFLFDKCAEILLETSMCLSHRGNFIEKKGNKFCINVVCGPDEYNPVVDNNLFTNMMVRKHFRFTLEVAEMLQEKRPEKYLELVKKCNYNDAEFARLRQAADNMYLAYDYENDVYMQDDNIMSKDPIDIESIPQEKLPLLVTMHPLNLWRFKVCKQADIVLATFLLHEEFTPEMRKKIFDIYEPITIHDSSLSCNTYSIAACDIGYYSEAYDYLKQASRMDLDNVNKNTFFGLHAACMGSCWMMIVNGYAGLRIYDGSMHFKPYCCDKWKSYSFRLKFNGSTLDVRVTPSKTYYRMSEGNDLSIYHNGKKILVGKEEIEVRNG